MKIKNTTKKKTLSIKATKAKTVKSKVLGLIFEKEKKSLVINTRFGIHTHLMPDPIDVLILNSKGKVVKIREELPPNKIFLWNPKFSTVVELPKRTIRKSGTKLGDKIQIME